MTDTASKNWTWNELDPLTQSMVATFAGSYGREPGQLRGATLVAFLSEIIPDLSSEDVIHTHNHTGARGIQNIIGNKLTSLDADQVRGSIVTIGELAGTDASMDLARQVSGDIFTRTFDTYPALRLLSELAVGNVRPDVVD